MKLKVLFFASLRDKVGVEALSVELPADTATLADVKAHVLSLGEPYASAFANMKRVCAAVNQEVANDDVRVTDGAEVAFFPPVTGG